MLWNWLYCTCDLNIWQSQIHLLEKSGFPAECYSNKGIDYEDHNTFMFLNFYMFVMYIWAKYNLKY